MSVLDNLNKLNSNPLILVVLIMLLANNFDLDVNMDNKNLMLGIGALLVYLHVTTNPAHAEKFTEGLKSKLTDKNENDSVQTKKLKDSLSRCWMKTTIQMNMLKKNFCGKK